MTSAHRPGSEGSVEEKLRRAEAPVRYDVEQGYARHQRLLASGANLPEWAAEIPTAPRSSFMRRWGPWLGAGLMLGALATWNAAQPGVRPRSAATNGAATTEDVANGTDERAAIGGTTRRQYGERNPSDPSVAPGTLAATPSPSGQIAPDGASAPRDVPAPGTPVVEPLIPRQAATPPVATDAERARATTSDISAPSKPESTAPSASEIPAKQPAQTDARPAAGAPASARVSTQGPMDREEVLQLAQAEQLLLSDPSAAIELVRKSNKQFKRGYLQHERSYIEVMALFAAGRTTEAQARAQWFLRDYRTSPYREKVKRAVDEHVSP